MPVLGLLLLIGTSQPGVADTAPAAKNPFLEAGKQLYVALEYEKALEQLNRARTAPNSSVADLVEIEEYTGLIKFDLGDLEGARTSFRTALALDPHAEIPADVSPKIQSEWQAMRREMIKTRRTAERQDHPAPEVASSTATPAAPPSVAATPLAVGGLTTPTPSPSEPTPVTYALLGGGAVGLVAGAILGGASIASYNGALSSAAAGHSPSSQANASVTEGRVGLGLAVVGAAAAVTGIVRWLSDRPSSETSVAAR